MLKPGILCFVTVRQGIYW